MRFGNWMLYTFAFIICVQQTVNRQKFKQNGMIVVILGNKQVRTVPNLSRVPVNNLYNECRGEICLKYGGRA